MSRTIKTKNGKKKKQNLLKIFFLKRRAEMPATERQFVTDKLRGVLEKLMIYPPAAY